MRKWIAGMLSVAILFVSGCGADVDRILQNESADDTEIGEETQSAEDGSDVLSAEDETVGQPADESGSVAASSTDEDLSCIYVYICGAVNNPGVYELQSQSRIYELVELAGGLAEDADESSVNLAQTMEDGEMIRILTVAESASVPNIGSDPSASQGADTDGSKKVNINTADAAELTTLSGIGEVKAAAIVTYREEHGPFGSAEEIMKVDGIAEATYAKIKEDITI